MILLIDNYDSFVYNIFQYLSEMGQDVLVRRNDKITLADIESLKPDKIVVSPGPCTPAEAGISIDVIKSFGPRLPVLGVCLGHQSIGAAFGGRIVRLERVWHGKTSQIYHEGKDVFAGLSNPFLATRYHSLIIEKASCPECLEVTAWTGDGVIMGVKHKTYPISGVQFHPESVLTSEGKKLLANFLK